MTLPGGYSFQPTLIGSLAAGLALTILLGLGAWQLQRQDWKTGLLDELETRSEAPPITLPPAFLPAELAFSRARLSGRFLAGRELRSAPRNLVKRPGLYVYTPFQLEDGRQILVERGWLPQRPGETAEPDSALPEGLVTFEAVLLEEGWGGSPWFRPDNDPAKNVWHYVDTLAMAETAGLQRPVAGLYAVALPGQLPGETLRARQPGIDVPDNHLEYAITWFSLAAILLVIFVIRHLRRVEA